MKRFIFVLNAAVLLLLYPQFSMAQGQQRDVLSWGMPLPPATTLPDVERLMEAGDRHWHSLDFAAAERTYSRAVRLIETEGQLADDALWKLAAMQYAQRERAAAARTLDRLAAAAERFGRPETQARALLESAILHHLTGNNDAALRSLDRLFPLRSSPHLSQQLREEIDTRIRR